MREPPIARTDRNPWNWPLLIPIVLPLLTFIIGGVIILQTPPAVFTGLYTRWPHRAGLIAGRRAGNRA